MPSSNLLPVGRFKAKLAFWLFVFLGNLPLWASWSGQDVGSVGVPGTDSYNATTGVYTIQGSGVDIGGTTDAFHFVYQTLAADGELEARVASIQNTNGSAKAGVMIRQSTAAGSINTFIAVSPASGIISQQRTALNGLTTSTQAATSTAPYWMRIVKDGGLITIYQSPDGASWTYAGITTLPALSSPVDIGFAVTSDNNALLCTATFDNITLSSQTSYAPTLPWYQQDIGTVGQSGAIHLENGSWSLYGAGSGITGTADGFHYAYQALSGNGVIIARLDGLSTSGTSSGIIMRQDLSAGSAEAAMVLNSSGLNFLTRSSSGATVTTTSGATVSAPYWVKLVRAGSVFYGYQSIDGSAWTLVGSQTINMMGTIATGLASASGTSSALSLGLMDRVALIPTGNYLVTGDIAAGDNHNVYLQSNGTVWAWGLNTNGQIGDGTTTTRKSPVQLTTLANMEAVSAGTSYSLALENDGTVWAWGLNTNGQLGDGTTTQHTSPEQLSTLSGMVAVSAGGSQSLALRNDGTVWAWGLNSNGQLGDGTTTQKTSPEQLSTLSGIVAISAGTSHSLALKSDGTVWVWGKNSNGQLGDGTTTQCTVPVKLTSLSNIVAISAGASHSLALDADGNLWAWGNNADGDIGDGTTTQRTSPVEITSLSEITAIKASNLFSLALKSDGTVWAWGQNPSGELGNGTTTQENSPVQVTGLAGATVISAGTSHSVAITSDSVIWAWGNNSYGQLGNGTTTSSSVPVSIKPVISSATAATATLGVNFSYLIKATSIPTSYNATGLPPGLSVSTTTGAISGIPTALGVYTAIISATNLSGTGSASLVITVNPPPPVITSPNTATGLTGNAFTYTITATNSPTQFNATGLPAGLSVNTSTGQISGTPTASGTTHVTISATNAGGTGTLSLTLTVSVPIPVVTSATTASGTKGVPFSYSITATNSPTSYSASGLPGGLSINTATGLISGTPTGAATSTVTLKATNAGGSGTATLTLTIIPPVPVISSAATATGTTGVAFSYSITATNTPTSYSATGLPAGLSINTSTGKITGTSTVAGTSAVTIGATNAGGTGTAVLTLTINPPAPVINSVTTATGGVGTAFSYTITATNSPTSYNATGLPGGLTVDTSTGIISGTPGATGTYSISISATNAGGTGTKTLALKINPAPPVITSAGAVTGVKGVTFSYTITATNLPTSYIATGLPSGLHISTTTGMITGTPAAVAVSTVTIKATNAGGTGTAILTVTINPAAPVISGAMTAKGTTGIAFSYTITASNSPTSFNAVGLPAGLSINTSTGKITGTPTAVGVSTVTISATNVGGTGAATLTLTINPPAPVISSGSSATGMVGTAFSYAIAATNSPTSFNATGLPTGLSINTTTGVISGTPTATGTSSVVLSAANAGGTGTKTLSLKVNPPVPVITSATMAVAAKGVAFSYTITASNSPTSFKATGLPAGLTINTSTGLISGSPTTTATQNLSVALSATNAGGTGTMTLALAINPTTPVISSAIVATSTDGVSFSYSITATRSPTSYSASGLPAGLSVNTSTGVISGSPTVLGSFAVTLDATNAAGTGTTVLNLTVYPPVPAITSSLSVTGITGGTFTYTVTGSNSPTSFGATGLPAGLAIDPGTGIISGTTTVTGTSSVAVSATNAGGTGTATLNLTFNPPTPAITSAATATGFTGTPFSYTVTANNTPTSFGATGLPSGLSIDPTSGIVSGTPAAVGTSTVSLSATNAGGTATQTLTLTVNLGLPVTSGLATWFNAGAGVALTSGGVTQWNDLSANQYVISQSAGSSAPTVSTDTTSGQPMLTFNGTQYLTNTYNQVAVTSDVTIFTVASTTAPGATATQFVIGNPFDGNGMFEMETDAGNQSFGTGGPFADGGPLPAVSGLSVNTVTYSQSSSLASFFSQGIANGTATVTGTNIGTGMTVGSLLYYGPYIPWTGNIAEIVVYNRVLTTSERQQVELYLANKYDTYAPGASWINGYPSAVQTEINKNQWNKSNADSYVAFQAANSGMLTTGLEAWFKADAGVSQVGGAVSAWADQTGNFTVTQAATGNQPGYIADEGDGMPCVSFNGSQWLFNPANMGIGVNQDSTIIAVASTTSPSSYQYMAFLGNQAGTSSRSLAYLNSSEAFDCSNDFVTGAAAPTNILTVEAATLDANGTSVTFYQNGVATGTGTLPTAAQPVTPGVTVGAYNNGGSPWQGNISEVLIYDHKLSSAELQQVNAYLANKYGTYNVDATWPLTYSSDVQELITANKWSQAQAEAYVASEAFLPVITSSLTASGTTGTSFSYTISATNSPTGFSATGLPAGLSLDPATGIISGIPTVAGTTTITLGATNGTGSGSATLTLTINLSAPVITSAPNLTGFVGAGVNYTITASNSATSFGATGLPAGLSVDPSTGIISGTPTTVGTSTVSLNATNSAGTGTHILTVTINPGVPVTSGLAIWLSASAGLTLSGGGVTQWNDLSPNQFSLTQSPGDSAPTVSTDTASGQPMLTFNGNQYLADVYDQAAVTSDVTIFTVASTTAPGATASQFVIGNFYDGNGLFEMETDAEDQTFATGGPFAHGGALPAGTGLSVSTVTYSQSSSLASFYSGGTANGTATLTGTNVGTGITVGSIVYSSPYLAWQGNIAEVVVYNRVLTTSERQQVELYLANKYDTYAPGATWIGGYSSAVQTEINKNQWNKGNADAYVAFQTANSGMLTTGLAAWFKADSGVAQTGGNVSSWTDQTGNFTVTQNVTGNQPGYFTDEGDGMPCVSFNGSQWLFNPANMGMGLNQDSTIVAVASTTSPSTYQYMAFLGNQAGTSSRSLAYLNSSEAFDCSNDFVTGAAAPNNILTVEAATLDANGTSVAFYQNGVASGVGTLATAAQPVTPGVTVGAYNNGGSPFQGNLAEVLIYDHKLSSAELQQVNAYLSDKYGTYNVDATWPLTYTSDVQELITANQWSHAQAQAYVASEALIPVITSPLTASGTTGALFSYIISATNGATSYSASGLPAGLSVDNTSGIISGTPSVIGSSTVTISATNAEGTGTQTLILNISAVAPVISSSNTATGLTGVAFNYVITADDAPATFSATGLPDGLTVNTTTGVISGIPTATGTSTVTIAATNGSGTNTATLTLTINMGLPVATGLTAWYEADSGIATTSGSVTQWNDQTGQYNITQTPGVNAPTEGTDSNSGKPVVQFDGSQWISTQNTVSNVSDVTIIAVASAINPNATGAIANLGYGYNTSATRALAYDNGKQSFVSGWPSGYAQFSDGGQVNPSTGLITTAVTYSQAANTATFYNNNVANGSASISCSSVINAISLGSLSYYGNFYGWNGNIAEVIIYNRVLTDNERQQVETYLANKYGIAPYVSSPTTSTATIGTLFSYSIAASDAPTSYGATGLPSGLTINSTTGVISGTPTVSGVFNISLSATNGGGTSNAGLTLTVYAAIPPVISNPNSEIGIAGTTFNYSILASNNPTSFGATGLPAGLSINTSTGTITGSPAVPGTSTVVLSASNAWGTGTSTVTFTVYPTLPVTSGLAAWFASSSGVTSTFGSVTQWNDLSGNSYNVSQTFGTTAPTLSTDPTTGVPVVAFNGGQYLNTDTQLFNVNDVTIITVASATVPSNSGTLVTVGNAYASNSARILGEDSDKQSFSNGTINSDGGAAVSNTHLNVNSITYSQSSGLVSFYSQGLANGTATVTSSALNAGLTLGSSLNYLPWDAWNGSMAEVIIYDHVLSDAERQQVENYLANKYGIAPVISSPITASGNTTTAFNYILTASGGPTSFGATGLPAGLTLDSTTGVISGTPSAVGTFTVAVSATNTGGTTTTTLSLTIIAGVPPVISSLSTASVTSGNSFTYSIVGSNNPSSYNATGLPTGLSINTGTGVISGTPTVAGTFTVSIAATNSFGTGTFNLVLTVYPPLVVTSGLAAWYRADAGISGTGTNVSQWNDQSPNGANVTQTNSTWMPTIGTDVHSGLPTVQFNGSQFLSTLAQINGVNDTTMFVIGSVPNFEESGIQVQVGDAWGTSYTDPGLGYYQGRAMFSTGINGNGYLRFSGIDLNSPIQNPYLIANVMTYSSSSEYATFYSNGVETSSQPYAYAQAASSGLIIGSAINYGIYYGWTGNISEIIVYNRVLSTTEVEQVEAYLAGKYNLPLSIPAPVITPNGGSSSSVSISTLPPATLRYTLDGTTPTSNSPVSTGSLTLTQSCPLSCAYFIGNVEASPVATAQFYVEDTGNIGISDAWQIEYFGHIGINPSAQSPGGSGLTNLQAYLYGYNPTLYSTNGDGLSDLTNYQLGYGGAETDINGYGLTNAQQLALGLDPFDIGVNPALPVPPSLDPNDHTPPVIYLISPEGATLVP